MSKIDEFSKEQLEKIIQNSHSNLPSKKTDISAYSDEDWAKI